MIRLFQLRDLPLVHRLGDSGVVLDAEAAAISYPHPVRDALVNRLVSRQYFTYVWKSDQRDSSAFVQLRCEEGCGTARLIFVGTSHATEEQEAADEVDEDIWLPFLEELIVVTATRGAHNLIAEVNESGPELPFLRRAGFAVYTRQDIWVSKSAQDTRYAENLRPFESMDEWDIFVLYSNVVPRLIQSVEPNPPINSGKNWVIREENELAALIHTRSGPVATWMRLMIHPNAHTKPRMIIRAAMASCSPSEDHPIFCCVRRYQSWLQGPLQEAGFEYWGSQAVMVKHMTKSVKQPSQVNELGLEAQAVTSSSTLVQGFSQPNGKHNQELR